MNKPCPGRGALLITIIASLLVLTITLVSGRVSETCADDMQLRLRARDLGEHARDLFRSATSKQDWEEAIETLKELAEILPQIGMEDRLVRVYLGMGKIYRELNEYDRAVESLNKCVDMTDGGVDDLLRWSALGNLGALYYSTGRYKRALKTARECVACAKRIDDAEGLAKCSVLQGLVYCHWGDYDKGLGFLERALAIGRKTNDAAVLRYSLMGVGAVYALRGDYPQAEAYYREAVRLARDTRSGRVSLRQLGAEGGPQVRLGEVYVDWGRYGDAVKCFQEAIGVAREMGSKDEVEQALYCLGDAKSAQGAYKEAVNYYERALGMASKLGHSKTKRICYGRLGEVYRELGRYNRSLEYFKKSLSVAERTRDVNGKAGILNELGAVHAAWGSYNTALDFFRKSLEARRKIGDKKGEAETRINVGKVCEHSGDFTGALKEFELASRIQAKCRIPTNATKSLIANLYLDAGDLDRVERLVEETGDDYLAGRFHLLKGNYERSQHFYRKAVERAEKNKHAENLFAALTGMGMALEGSGDYDRAAEFFQRAVDWTEELRSSLTRGQRETFFDVKIRGFYRTAPYEGLARVLTRLERHSDAFTTSEFTKARVFAEAMSRRPDVQVLSVPKEVTEQESTLISRITALKKRRQEAREAGKDLAVESLDPQIEKLDQELAAFKKRLREKYPLYAATKYPEPMPLSDARVNEDELILAYDVTDSGVIIYLSKGRELVRVHFSPIPREELDRLVRRFRDPLEVDTDNFYEKLESFDFVSGKKLADLLLGAMLPAVPEDAALIVVPDDSLGVLPFEMLLLNDSGAVTTDGRYPCVTGTEFFGDRNGVSYSQSVTALTLARTYRSSGTGACKNLVIVDPVFSRKDERLGKMSKKRQIALMKPVSPKLMAIQNEKTITFPRLKLTARLGEILTELDPERTVVHSGLEASKSVLLSKPLDDYAVLVVATHGYFGTDLPGIQEPVLVLSLAGGKNKHDGFLRMSEVMTLKMNAEIVALTACQSGLGRRLTGEGTMGMGRAFQFAGAQSVLMSLWSVGQKSAVMLATHFFRHLKNGKDKLHALKAAREEIRSAGFDHPFFWAPFILVGEVH